MDLYFHVEHPVVGVVQNSCWLCCRLCCLAMLFGKKARDAIFLLPCLFSSFKLSHHTSSKARGLFFLLPCLFSSFKLSHHTSFKAKGLLFLLPCLFSAFIRQPSAKPPASHPPISQQIHPLYQVLTIYELS